MNGIRSFSLMLFLLFFPLLLEAQHVLDLQECLQIGLRNNYDLRIIRIKSGKIKKNYCYFVLLFYTFVDSISYPIKNKSRIYG